MSTVQRLLIVLLLIVCSSQAASAADGTATLGEDPRPYAVILSSNTRKGIGDDWVSDQFGFAYMQNVQKGSPQTDYCYTNPRAGSSATLKAIDGTASPENPEVIERDVGASGPNSVVFEGRTGDCYYLVMGTYSGGTGGFGGETSHWYSEFDTNESPTSPHFVVTIEERYCEADDRFPIDSAPTKIVVELQHAGGIEGAIYFRLYQMSLPDADLGNDGAILFPDSDDDGTFSCMHSVYKDNQSEVYAVGMVKGKVSVIAIETDENGNPLSQPPIPATAVKDGLLSGTSGAGASMQMTSPSVRTETVSAIVPINVNIVLTLDDGPVPRVLEEEKSRTAIALDLLAERDIKAAFFVQTHVKVPVRGGTEAGGVLIGRQGVDGHTSAIHTGSDTDHVPHQTRVQQPAYDANDDGVIDANDGQNALESDLIRAKLRIVKLTGVAAKYVRSPGGGRNEDTRAAYARQGLKFIHWDIDSTDSKRRVTVREVRDALKREVAKQIKDNKKVDLVILFHDVKVPTCVNLGAYIDAIKLGAQDANAQVVFPDTRAKLEAILDRWTE